jgi:hypothetical protein
MGGDEGPKGSTFGFFRLFGQENLVMIRLSRYFPKQIN